MKPEQKTKPFWLNAKMTMKLTGWTKSEMHRLRKDNPGWYQLKKTGGYLYNANAIPLVFLKTAFTERNRNEE